MHDSPGTLRTLAPIFVLLAVFGLGCHPPCKLEQPLTNVEADHEAAGAIKVNLSKIATSGDASGNYKAIVKQNFDKLSDKNQACMAMANFSLCLVQDKNDEVKKAGIAIAQQYGTSGCVPQFQPLLQQFNVLGVNIQ